LALKDSHKEIKKDLSVTDTELNTFLEKVNMIAESHDNKALKTLVEEAKNSFKKRIPKIHEQVKSLSPAIEKEISKHTSELKKEIDHLKKTNETVTSNNYLLEYKKKDLLLLADNLEEAYEEISAKNVELKEQKRQISEQTKELKKANAEILEINDELEQQKEAILDQADYLHEANKTITKMHAEVQKQKDEILRANEELVRLNNEKNNLIGIVAHDLKSPLNQIKGLISVIKVSAQNLDEQTSKYIDTIDASATRLNEMVAKILDVEAIESQTLNINFEDTNLSELLTECAERFKVNAVEKEIELIFDIEDGLVAHVDPDYTNQIYENLISNAIKFSPKYLKIFISLKEKDGKAICTVKDEGPGISKDDMKKLFGKYQKLSAKPTGNETSTGLGLSIVKKYVEAMKGEIWCESEINKGASFSVSFDLAN